MCIAGEDGERREWGDGGENNQRVTTAGEVKDAIWSSTKNGHVTRR